MTNPRRLALTVRIAVLVTCFIVPEQADADWFDWLSGRSTYYPTAAPASYAVPTNSAQPVSTFPGYTPTTCAQPVYAQPAASPAICPQPTYATAPQWSARPAWNCLWPFRRSSWTQVPVTNYRYVAANDFTTGTATLTPQPCQTSFWQPRPVVAQPYRSRSWFSWLHPWRRAAYQPAYYGMAANYPCSTCGQIPTATTNTYYPTSVPATQIVSGSPSVPASQTIRGLNTQGVLPSVPADTRPQLDPGTWPQLQNGAAYRQPAANVEWPPQTVQPAAAGVETARPVPPEVKPIPDAEAEREAARMDGVPALLSPSDASDRSALQIAPNGRVVVPISWPANARPQTVSPPPTSNEVWDDRGWKSERAW